MMTAFNEARRVVWVTRIMRFFGHDDPAGARENDTREFLSCFAQGEVAANAGKAWEWRENNPAAGGFYTGRTHSTNSESGLRTSPSRMSRP
jgi:hypothetical protein